jgi:hypothetical protein
MSLKTVEGVHDLEILKDMHLFPPIMQYKLYLFVEE